MTTAQAVVARTQALATQGRRIAISSIGAVGISISVGLAIAHGGLYAGGFLVLVVAAVLAANFAISREAALWGLLAWGTLNAIAYPFVRADPYFTSDRLWILALAICLLSPPPASARARLSAPSRLVLASALALLLTYGTRAILTPHNTLGAMQTWIDAIVLPVLLLAIAHRLIREPSDCRRLLGSLAIAGTVLAAIGLLGYVLGFELASRSGGALRFDPNVHAIRISGPYPAPEPYGLSILVCFAATLGWTQLSTSANRYSAGAPAAALQALAIGLTLFRAAWIGVAIAALIVLAPRKNQLVRLMVAGAAIAAGVALLVAVVGSSEELTARLSNSKNAYGRVATFQQDLNVFAGHPVTGVGVNQFEANVTPLTTGVFHGVLSVNQPHDSYLGLLAEQGVIGLMPFFFLSVAVIWLIRSFRRKARTQDDQILVACLSAAGIGYLVMSLTLTMLPYGPSNAFLALLIGAASGRLDQLKGNH
jgi:O-antigen ligase